MHEDSLERRHLKNQNSNPTGNITDPRLDIHNQSCQNQ